MEIMGGSFIWVEKFRCIINEIFYYSLLGKNRGLASRELEFQDMFCCYVHLIGYQTFLTSRVTVLMSPSSGNPQYCTDRAKRRFCSNTLIRFILQLTFTELKTISHRITVNIM